MKEKTNKLEQFKQWILSIVIGRFRYTCEYVSPFGEYWLIYRLWFGFIPIKYTEIAHKWVDGRENENEVMEYVAKLNDLVGT